MHRLLEFGCLVLFSLMLLHPDAALSGARDGLLLWFQTMIPSLFPYMILTSVLMGPSAMSFLEHHVTPHSRRLLGISGEGCYCILTGFLCGYPLGAKTVAALVRENRISLIEGQYLLRFCNNASPGFLISYVCGTILQNRLPLRFCLLCFYGPVLLTAIIGQPALRRQLKHQSTAAVQKYPMHPVSVSPRSIDDAIVDGFDAMIRLCGYLMLFSVIIKMVTVILPTVTILKAVLAGILEITTGLHELSAYCSVNQNIRILICSLTVFGGCSCIAQTAGMCKNSGLRMTDYIVWKLIQGALAALFAVLSVCLV